MKRVLVLCVIVTIIAFGMVSCSAKKEEAPAAAAPAAAPAAAAPAAPVSDGSEDLTIDYQVNLAGSDTDNYFNWKTNVRYMAAEDKYDAVSGASAAGSTHLFMMALYDIEAKATMTSALRGLLLFGNNPGSQTLGDNLIADKAADGTITIQYCHRGSAYKFVTDSKGVLSLPETTTSSRKIGSTSEIESQFSADGTAAGVDYAKVWASDVQSISADADSLYYWDGDLQVTLDGDMLKIAGVLTAVPRK